MTTPNPTSSVLDPMPAGGFEEFDCVPLDLGQMTYPASMTLQAKLVLRRKLHEVPDCLLFVQYLPTLTLGRSGSIAHLLATREDLRDKGVDFFCTDRGGDITYHGPGQLIVYPILDLKKLRMDLHWYLRQLEGSIINTLGCFGIQAERIAGATGVWVNGCKIAAVGVRSSQWVTSHGLALNVDPDLSFFDLIVPCGLANRGVTSMLKLLRTACPGLSEVRQKFCECFAAVFVRRVQMGLLESRSTVYSFLPDSTQGAPVNGSR